MTDAEVIEELTAAGPTVADYFLIGESPYCVNNRGELLGMAADEEAIEAMVAYLRRVGAHEYSSHEEFKRLWTGQ